MIVNAFPKKINVNIDMFIFLLGSESFTQIYRALKVSGKDSEFNLLETDSFKLVLLMNDSTCDQSHSFNFWSQDDEEIVVAFLLIDQKA